MRLKWVRLVARMEKHEMRASSAMKTLENLHLMISHLEALSEVKSLWNYGFCSCDSGSSVIAVFEISTSSR